MDDADLAPGRAARRRRSAAADGHAELNLVSMIDVFAVLVFFLLVTSAVAAAHYRAFGLQLPQAGSGTPAPTFTPSIRVGRDALLLRLAADAPEQRIDRTARGHDLAALRTALAALPATAGASLIVWAERRVPYGDVVRVIDTARGAGAARGAPLAEVALGPADGPLP